MHKHLQLHSCGHKLNVINSLTDSCVPGVKRKALATRVRTASVSRGADICSPMNSDTV
jgi:hypothetical protein